MTVTITDSAWAALDDPAGCPRANGEDGTVVPAGVGGVRRPGLDTPASSEPSLMCRAREEAVTVRVESFGRLHGAPAGDYDLTIDLRDFIRDPDVSPHLRASTGLAAAVRANVLAAPGARALIQHAVGATLALLKSAPSGRPVRIGFSCRGGRHRSVVAAEAAAEQIRLAGHAVVVVHHHLNEPVRWGSR